MDNTSPEPPGLATAGDRSPAVGINQGIVNTGDTTVQVPLVLPSPADVPAPHGMHNLPRPVGHPFVGRVAEMAALERALQPRNERAARHVVTQAVSGLGGIGKSTLALHFAHGHRSDYTAVWWIDAETPETITSSLGQLTVRGNPGTNTSGVPSAVLAEWALAWLDTHPGWLLVFDNVTHPDHVAPYLARLTSGNHLITSRLTYGWHDLDATPLHLDVLTPSAATSLLHQLAGLDDSSEPTAARELADELGCLPLALEQAGAYIRRTRDTYSSYLHRFRTKAARMLGTPGNGDPHGVTIARTWRVTLDTIAERDPLAVRLLHVMAWLAPHAIPRALLANASDEEDAELDALALLNDFSMITLSEKTADIHRLVQAVARTADADDPHRTELAIQEAQFTSATLLHNALPNDPTANLAGWPCWRALLPHIDAYLTHTHPNTDTTDTFKILFQTSQFLWSQGQVTQAARYANRSAATSARIKGEDHRVTLASRMNLADIYRDAGDLDHAIPLYEQIVSDSIRIFGKDHSNTLAVRNNLAYAYREAGKLEQVIPILKQNLADRIRIHGPDHHDTLSARHNLSGAYREAGDLGRALPLLKQDLADSVRVLGEDHEHTLRCRENLADAYLEAGNLSQALSLLKRTLNDTIRAFSQTHPRTVHLRFHLAHAYLEAGNLGRAIPLYEQALAEGIRVLGEDHADNLAYRSHLAAAYLAAGDLGRAIPTLEKNLAESIRVFGEDHPKTHEARDSVEYLRTILAQIFQRTRP